ncbi:MAG: helix-turn-helix transcriptional regulator [Rhizobiales bacterium]|nr:helix-turn-helix transcriptional regulator [Hyphomicrobiales bacterium]
MTFPVVSNLFELTDGRVISVIPTVRSVELQPPVRWHEPDVIGNMLPGDLRGHILTVRENIATNLRALCAERGSIAQCCREAGINRQQFNRYITGEAIPNRANLQKICRYFGITETELFQAPQAVDPSNIALSKIAANDPNWSRILDNVNKLPLAAIDDGAYYVYYRMPDEGAEIARSIMFIRTDGSIKTFRRITNISTHSLRKWHYFQGDHKGVVIERRHWINFIGIDADGRDEPSLLSVQWIGGSPPLYVGTAMVFSIDRPLTLPVALEPLAPNISPRQGLRGCNIYSIESEEISPIIKNFLDAKLNK